MKYIDLQDYKSVEVIVTDPKTDSKDILAFLGNIKVPKDKRTLMFRNIGQVVTATEKIEKTGKYPVNEGQDGLYIFMFDPTTDRTNFNYVINYALAKGDDNKVYLFVQDNKLVQLVTAIDDHYEVEPVTFDEPVVEAESVAMEPIDQAFTDLEEETKVEEDEPLVKPHAVSFFEAYLLMRAGVRFKRLNDVTKSIYSYQHGYTTQVPDAWRGEVHVTVKAQLHRISNDEIDASWRPSASDLDAQDFIPTDVHLLPLEFNALDKGSYCLNYGLQREKEVCTLTQALPIVTDVNLRNVIVITTSSIENGDLLSCMLTDMRTKYLNPGWDCATVFNLKDLGPWDTVTLNAVTYYQDEQDDDPTSYLKTALETYGKIGIVIDVEGLVTDFADNGMEYEKANEVGVDLANAILKSIKRSPELKDMPVWLCDLEETKNQVHQW